MVTPHDRDTILARMDVVSAIPVYANLEQELKEDFEIAFRAVSLDGLALAYAPESIRRNPAITERAIRNSESARVFSLYQKTEKAA